MSCGSAGGSQPVTMESWLEKQREQSKNLRLQQKDATENLHKYKGVNGMQAVGSDVKDELKKKEQEAAENLRNYRAQAALFTSNRKDNTAGKTTMEADVVAPIPGRKLDTIQGKLVIPQVQAAGNSLASDRGRSESQGTADWSVISGVDSDSDRGLSSTPVNVDMSEITAMFSNGADAAAGINQSANTNGDETPLSSSYIEASSSAEDEKIEKKWHVAHVTVSFGLLIHENDSPTEGTYSSSDVQNDIVKNLMSKLRLITDKSLNGQSNAMVAKQDVPMSMTVQKDGK